MALPFEKGSKWRAFVSKFKRDKGAIPKDLECFIGKIIRFSASVPGSIACLKSLRRALYSSVNNWDELDDNCIFELNLWNDLVLRSMDGVPFVKLLLRMPT